MPERQTITEDGFKRPKLPGDNHRPAGVPRPRETKSQEAQLKSVHKHGTAKGHKAGSAGKPEPAKGDQNKY